MKVQISLDDKLVERLDNYASNNYMSRSGLISFACNQYLNQAEVIVALTDISLAIQKVADKGVLDNETREQLQDFERLCKLFTQK